MIWRHDEVQTLVHELIRERVKRGGCVEQMDQLLLREEERAEEVRNCVYQALSRCG